MTRGNLREYVEAVQDRYFLASRKEKGKILDEFTKVTGHHRKAAIRLFHRGNHPRPNKKRGRPQRYGAAVVRALRVAYGYRNLNNLRLRILATNSKGTAVSYSHLLT